MSKKPVNSIVSPWLEKTKSSNVVRRNNLYEDEMMEDILTDTSTINTDLIDIDKLNMDVKDISDMDLGKLAELEGYFKEIIETSDETVKSYDILRDLKYNKLPKSNIVKFNEDIYEQYTPINDGSYARLISVMHNMTYSPIDEKTLEEDFVKKEPKIVIKEDLKSDFTDNKLSIDTTAIEDIDLEDTGEDILVPDMVIEEQKEPPKMEEIAIEEVGELFIEEYVEDLEEKEEEPVETIPKIEINTNLDFADDDDDDSVYKVEKLNINNKVKDGTEVG